LISDLAQGINSFFGVPLHQIAEDAIITSTRIAPPISRGSNVPA